MFNKKLALGLFVFVLVASVVAADFGTEGFIQITIDYPIDENWYNTDIDYFDWHVVSGGPAVYCWYSVDGLKTDPANCDITSVSISPIGEGINHTIEYYAENAAAEYQNYKTKFSIDKTPPTTSDDYGAKDGIWQNSDQTITLFENCDISGCDWTRYCTDATDTCDPLTGIDYTVPVLINTEGITYFRYASRDNAGNVQTTVSRIVKIDKTDPIVDAGPDVITNVQVLQDATVDGSVSGVASYLWIGDAEIIFGTDDAEDTTIESTTDGDYVIRLTVVDNAGNSAFDEINFVWDVTDPVTTDDAPVGWQSADVTVTLTPTDATSGVADTLYCVDQNDTCVPGISGTSILVDVEGVNYVRYYSTDVAGNDEEVNSVSVSVDKSVPTITDDYVNDGLWVNTDQLVTLDPQDIVSGIKEVKYCEGAACVPDIVLESPYELNYDSDQSTIVRYQAFDNADNPSLIGEYNVMFDKSNPTTSDDYLNDGVWVNIDQTITLIENCDISGCDWTRYCIGDICDPSIGTDYVAPVEFSNENVTVFRYASQDNAGNTQETVERKVMIDKVAPVTTSSAISEDVYTSPAEIILSCTDNLSGCSNTLYCYASINNCTPNKIYSGKITISSDGVWFLRFRSNDVAGNLENIQNASNNITINIPPPTGSPSGGGGRRSSAPIVVETLEEEEEAGGEMGEVVESPVEEDMSGITGAVVGGGERPILKDILAGVAIVLAAGLCIFLYRRWWMVKNNLPGSKK